MEENKKDQKTNPTESLAQEPSPLLKKNDSSLPENPFPLGENFFGENSSPPPKEKPKLSWLKRTVKMVEAYGLILFSIFSVMVVYDLYFANFSLRSTTKEEFIEIPPNSNLYQSLQILHQQGIIPRIFDIYWAAKFWGGPWKAGYYSFTQGMTMRQIIDTLKQGRQAFYKVTIPEGLNAMQIFEILKQSPIKNEKDYERYFRSSALIGLTPFNEAKNIEGLLAPDTYFFPIGFDEFSILQTMIKNFKLQLPAEFEKSAGQFHLSPYKLLILASIIEKETGKAEDRGLIASVFHNRLRIKMRLQTDPTVLYGKKDFNATTGLNKQDLKTPTAYNTYIIYGLPPSPIANPGKDSLLAAMKPEKTNYLYFVAKGNGASYFSENLKKHNSAVYKYQILPYQKPPIKKNNQKKLASPKNLLKKSSAREQTE